MMGAAAACRPEEPLELHWDEVCVLSLCFIDYWAGNNCLLRAKAP